jgi:hypothetical protein
MSKPDDKTKRKYKPTGRAPGVTIIEQSFVDQLTREDADRPRSITQAFRQSLAKAGGAPITVMAEASRMHRRPQVKEAIRIAHERLDANRLRERRSARATIENALWEEYHKAKAPRDRLAALKTLAQMAPSQDVPVDPTKDPDTALGKESILRRIEGIMSKAGGDPLDITPIDSNTDDDNEEASSIELASPEDINDDSLPAVIDVEVVTQSDSEVTDEIPI